MRAMTGVTAAGVFTISVLEGMGLHGRPKVTPAGASNAYGAMVLDDDTDWRLRCRYLDGELSIGEYLDLRFAAAADARPRTSCHPLTK
jgi:hypothetical protein